MGWNALSDPDMRTANFEFSCDVYREGVYTVSLFWYPFVRVPSTTKSPKRVELNSLQKLIGLLESSLLSDTRG